MNPTTHRAPTRVLGALGLATGLALAATACSATEPSPAADGATGSAVPHGFVEGASESREPQLRLLAVSATGETVLHDLLTAETTTLDPIDAPRHSATDGRFLVTSDAERTTVVDGGAWTVDHGDHTHYYAAEPRVVGTLDGGGPVEVHSSETTTTITWPERGEAVALDRDALGQGDVEQRAAVDASVLLPFGEHLVQAGDDGVRVLDGDGRAASGTAPQACTEPTGGIVTRAGAVVGCADGAVVVDDDGGTTFVELPDGAERPTAFAARSGRPTVAGVAGTTGVWLLDARDRSWRHLATERPLRTVVAVDDADEHVVGVDDQGRVVVLTAATAAVATTEPLIGAGADADAVPLLQLDAQRAYLADPDDGVVHEIDFADSARVARTIELPIAPAAFAEVGL